MLLPWSLCPLPPLNVICTSLIIPWLLSKVTLTYTGSIHSMYLITLSIALAVLKYQSSPRHMHPFCNRASFYVQKFNISPTLPAGRLPLISCLRLLHYFRGYPHWRPFLHPHPGTPHAVVTGAHLSWMTTAKKIKIVRSTQAQNWNCCKTK